MATAKSSLVGKTVRVHQHLLDSKGHAHPFAGLFVDLVSKTGRNYTASGPEDQTAVLHDGDFDVASVADITEGDIVPVGEIKHEILPLDAIKESPFNPRKTFSQLKLTEMAETIALVGVMQEILVRPMWAGDVMTHYEIVFGHRRYRASVLAGVSTIPAMIRELTDVQSARLQAIENLQREDLDPLEEAQGYADLLNTPGVNALEVGKQIGKSKTYIYSQMKLLKLCEVGKRLVRCGVLKPELAIEVGRLTTEDLQIEALKMLVGYADISLAASELWEENPPDHFSIMSFRRGREAIEQRYRKHLKNAIFGRSIMFLVADRPDCNSCEDRAGNIPEIKATGDRGDLCTNPVCFEQKTQAHLAQVAADAAQLGPVVAADDARALVNTYDDSLDDEVEYLELDAENFRMVDDTETVRAALGKKLKPTDIVRIVHPRTGAIIEAVHQDLLIKHGLIEPEEPEETQAGIDSLSPAEKKVRDEQSRRDRAAAERNREVEVLTREKVFGLVCDLAAGVPRKPADLEAMLCILWDVAQYGDQIISFDAWLRRHNTEIADLIEVRSFGDEHAEVMKKVYQWIEALPTDKQAQLCLELCLLLSSAPFSGSGEPDVLLRLAPAYGVDLKAARKAAEEEHAASAETREV